MPVTGSHEYALPRVMYNGFAYPSPVFYRLYAHSYAKSVLLWLHAQFKNPSVQDRKQFVCQQILDLKLYDYNVQELGVLPLEKLIMLFVDGKITKELVPKKSKKCGQKSAKTALFYRLSRDSKDVGFRTNTTSFGKVAFGSALFNNVFMSVAEHSTLIQKMLN